MKFGKLNTTKKCWKQMAKSKRGTSGSMIILAFCVIIFLILIYAGILLLRLGEFN